MQKSTPLNIAHSRLRKEAELADKEASNKLRTLLKGVVDNQQSVSNVTPFIHLASPSD